MDRKISLKDWNEVLQYVGSVKEERKKVYGNFTVAVYTMYDNTKGIRVGFKDAWGEVYQWINTGIHGTKDGYIQAFEGIFLRV